ncbi:MAG TPA: putative bicarbonate transporter, IctB family [Cyanobacteria bacterium UBA11149]|nr:putative bicarbonate transporter, IctB family [Cyanobacteria bacterium UBA11367]HBE60890.1 putative bicarbonate transporter, IctB family [Cyanobacteria bacterium UBA11366]HBK63426.1 putative bicarbonate transporter, IctB family [Cyanobacteria bacterium UBA11166]HBR72153.1 putative bicarbonate transporter, IctB family [Cyanobacteria bacterium UBA11159]HBS68483.1 putative bicarbonate transporter, IctB family [Cyanobacteria bacterium UBA11153]HBW88594.1 putative bicarbonate transporter, IctB f
MNSVWQQFTLSDLRLYQWRSASYLYRLVGLLQSWRSSSFLLQWSEPIGALLVALVFALAPFTSNALVGVLLAACGAFWLLLTLSDDLRSSPELTRFITPIHLLVLLYWGISLVATALSEVKVDAAKGLMKLTLYLLFFALMSRVLRSQKLRSWIIGVFLHVSLIVSVYGIRQYIFGVEELATWTDPTSESAGVTRVFSYLGNPNLLAGYLLPAVLLSLGAIFAWQRWLPKALAVTMFVVNSFCLIVTYSRGGWIGFVISLFLFLVMLVFWYSFQLPPRWRIWAMPSLLGICVAAIALAVIFVPPVRVRVASMFAGREDSSNNFRINVWSAVLDMIRDRPILGIGPGNNAFNKIYPRFQRPRFTALSAYSIFLEVAVETGIIGFTCFLWLLVVTFNLGVQQLKRLREAFNPQGFWLMAAISAIAGMLGHGFVDTVWYRPEVSTLWWLMVALIASYYLPPQADRLISDSEE